jgi:hypothetical protein
MVSDTLSLIVFGICVSTYTTGFSPSGLAMQIVEVAIFVPLFLVGVSRAGGGYRRSRLRLRASDETDDVPGAAIGGQQDLSSFQLARDRLARLDPIPFIHPRPPRIEGTRDESPRRAGSRPVATTLYTKAGPVSGVHPSLAGAGRSRPAALLSRLTAVGPPDGDHARARRSHPTPVPYRRYSPLTVNRSEPLCTGTSYFPAQNTW